MTPHDHDRPIITVGVAAREHAALAFAAEEAQLSGSDIRLVHAYTVPPSPPGAMAAVYGIDVDGSFRKDGLAVLADATAVMAAEHGGVVVHTVLKQGRAPRVLAEASASSRLVVLGPDDSRPWYSRLFVSRVSRTLVESAGCPVVVVPDSWDPQTRCGHVTLLIDCETVAHGPLRFAFEHAARHHQALRIIHLQESDGPDEGAVSWHDMTRLIESWSSRHPGVQHDVEVVRGSVAIETVKSFETTGLLVLGRPHEQHLVVAFRHSLARSVIEHADCPVAVVPADYDG